MNLELRGRGERTASTRAQRAPRAFAFSSSSFRIWRLISSLLSRRSSMPAEIRGRVLCQSKQTQYRVCGQQPTAEARCALQQAVEARVRACSCASPPSPPASTKAARCSEARSPRWCVLRGAAGSEAGGSREWERAKTATPPRVSQPDAWRHAAHFTSSLLWFCSAAPCTFAAMLPERRGRLRGSEKTARKRGLRCCSDWKNVEEIQQALAARREATGRRRRKKSVCCPVTKNTSIFCVLYARTRVPGSEQQRVEQETTCGCRY